MSEQLIQTPGVFGENGNFLLERELGTGGMGGVYMGRDKMLDRPVAVKVMLKEYGSDAEFLEKFKKEAQSVARLIHPNIAQVYSYGICDGMPYMAMELAPGGSLFSIMNANPGKTDVARVIKICQQVAQALQCASDQGFVHGDVKPENVLLDANGNAKLVDFGLAAMQANTEEIWGTPYYISPEKVRKEPVDFRSDMYSLGGTLYHALTGVAPFEGADSIAVVKKRFEGLPKKPSEIRPDLTPAIDNLVMKMLSLNKEDRFPSFEALIEAFKNVLTSGLSAAPTAQTVAATPQAAPAKPASTGARRLKTSLRTRRPMTTARTGATSLKKKIEGEDAEVEALPTVKNLDAEDDEEEGGGNVGLKVFGFVFGAIALIGIVVGLLIWFKVASSSADAADKQAQIDSGITKARGAIATTVASAGKFAEECDTLAEKAVSECQKSTDALAALLPEEVRPLLKPAPTQELLDAIASTNEVPPAAANPATTNAPAAAVQSAAQTQAVARVVQSAASTLPKFRAPTEDEMDPASPEGEAYLKAKKEFEAEQLKKRREGKAEESAPAAAATPSSDAAAPAPEKKNDQVDQAVVDMNDLWGRAYSCQASAIRIRQAIKEVIAKAAEADEIKGSTREDMDKLGELSKTLVDMVEKVKGSSKDVDNLRKGASYIKTKGEKAIAQTEKRLRIEKLEKERAEKAAAAAAAEAERKKKQEEERKAKIEAETASARAKFDAIVAQGCLRQLDWKSAVRMLESLKAEFTTPEGQLEADLQLKKVNNMKMMHDIFIKNLKGYTFVRRNTKNSRCNLKNCIVEAVNEKQIGFLKKGTQNKFTVPWQKFYKDYTFSLSEIINAFVVDARKPNGKYKISSPLEWANAMTGAALTLQLVCSEASGAVQYSETLMKTVLKEFPDYEKTAKAIFPDMKLEDAATEEE